MSEQLFADRNVDSDTNILGSQYLQVGEYDLLIEVWSWEGITAKSLIFLSPQIQDLPDAEVEQLAGEILSLPEEEKSTLSRKADFTYFNFGFVTD